MSGRGRLFLGVLLLAVLIAAGGIAYKRYFDYSPGQGAGFSTSSGDGFPGFDVVRITRGGAGLMTGHAPPASKVEVLADGKMIGEATADAKGEWILIIGKPLKSGGVELGLQSGDMFHFGRKPILSPFIVVVVVPGTAKDHFIDGEGEGVVVIESPRDRAGSSMIMQRPGRVTAGEAADGLGFDVMDYGDDGKAVLSGRAPAYSEVRFYLDNHFQGYAVADQNGRWEIALKDVVGQGQHVMRADQVGDKGKVQLRLEAAFERLKPLDPLKTNEKIIVQTAKDMWQISRKIVDDGFHYALIFRADKDQIKDPDLVYPDQVFDLPN